MSLSVLENHLCTSCIIGVWMSVTCVGRGPLATLRPCLWLAVEGLTAEFEVGMEAQMVGDNQK